MSNYELTLPPVRPQRNPLTGRFLKGHVPANKGKKWDEFMPKRSQRRSAKGWKNLEKHRVRPATAGRKPKQVVAATGDGKFYVFANTLKSAEWVGGNRYNIARCCRFNEARKVNKQDYSKGRPKGSGCINTDHQYLGVRFYFETDNIWIQKIKT